MAKKKRPIETIEDLEQHRLKYHEDGSNRPPLAYHDLSSREIEVIFDNFVNLAKKQKDEIGLDRVFLNVLVSWGIMCNHPDRKSRWSKDGRWFFCECCGTHVIGQKSGAGMKRSVTAR